MLVISQLKILLQKYVNLCIFWIQVGEEKMKNRFFRTWIYNLLFQNILSFTGFFILIFIMSFSILPVEVLARTTFLASLKQESFKNSLKKFGYLSWNFPLYLVGGGLPCWLFFLLSLFCMSKWNTFLYVTGTHF